jgi:hypothetical protein
MRDAVLRDSLEELDAIANPVAEAVAALIRERCDTIRNRFRN